MTRTAMKRGFKSIAIMAGAVVVLSVGISAVALATLGGNGTFKLCVKASSVRVIGSTRSCATGETTLSVYTKDGADARFLTVSGTAANADKLDGIDSTRFVTTNCIGYPHADIDWHKCDLTGANLTGAFLIEANLNYATLQYSNLMNSNLAHALMRGANLKNADLASALLLDATLSNADLTRADLTNADLTGAILTGVTWSSTTCPDGTNSDNDGGTCVGHLT